MTFLKEVDKVIDVTKNRKYSESAYEFFQEVDAGYITHAIICYRKSDGSTRWRIFNEEHLTYILGMMERIKFEIQKQGIIG